MDHSETIARLNANAPGFIKMLGGGVCSVDLEEQSCSMSFEITEAFCHSGDIVQGGFVTAMLDAAMSHAVFGVDDSVAALSSLEIKTSYLDATRAGKLVATGRVRKLGYKTAFLEGELRNAEGTLTATSSSVAKVTRAG